MTIKEYITMYYPIKEKIVAMNTDVVKRVEEADDLPYDKIGLNEFGKLCKLVIISEDDGAGREYCLPVLEVLSLDREALIKSGEEDLLNVYDNLIDEVEICEINLVDLSELVNSYKKEKARLEAINKGVSSIC